MIAPASGSDEGPAAICFCREGLTHWMAGRDHCQHCQGSLTAGPWDGEELVYGMLSPRRQADSGRLGQQGPISESLVVLVPD